MAKPSVFVTDPQPCGQDERCLPALYYLGMTGGAAKKESRAASEGDRREFRHDGGTQRLNAVCVSASDWIIHLSECQRYKSDFKSNVPGVLVDPL